MQRFLLIAALVAAVVSAEGGDAIVIAARIKSCSGWRLNSLPKVKEFLNHVAPQFPAVEVQYVGGDPRILFLNVYGKEVSQKELTHLDGAAIEELLLENGITRDTPAPQYLPPVFTETNNCVAWRQTSNCNPLGDRESLADEDCNTNIEFGRSGFCECKGEGRVNIQVTCDHPALVCEEACMAGPTQNNAANNNQPGSKEDDEF